MTDLPTVTVPVSLIHAPGCTCRTGPLDERCLRMRLRLAEEQGGDWAATLAGWVLDQQAERNERGAA